MSTIRKIWSVISTAIVAVAILFAVGLVGVRLVGLDVYTVLSGSMEPTYHTGSVIWVKDAEPQDIQVGDPITFVMNEDLVVATHRVVEIDQENQEFITKGDANDAIDANPVHFNNLIGTPVFTVPGLGYFVNWIQNPPGTYMAISIGAVLLILMFLPDLFAKSEEDGKKPKKGKKAKMQARPVAPAVQQDPAAQRVGRHGRHAAPAAQQAPRPQTQDRPRGRHAR